MRLSCKKSKMTLLDSTTLYIGSSWLWEGYLLPTWARKIPLLTFQLNAPSHALLTFCLWGTLWRKEIRWHKCWWVVEVMNWGCYGFDTIYNNNALWVYQHIKIFWSYKFPPMYIQQFLESYSGNIYTKSIVHGHKACMDLALPYKAVHFRKWSSQQLSCGYSVTTATFRQGHNKNRVVARAQVGQHIP